MEAEETKTDPTGTGAVPEVANVPDFPEFVTALGLNPDTISDKQRQALRQLYVAEYATDELPPEETVGAPPDAYSDPFQPLLGVPDAVLLTCPVASKNLGLVGVPGMVTACDAAVEVDFNGQKIVTSRDNLTII